MSRDYYLILKTGQAEIRAIENTDRKTLEKTFPVIELTRGRKKTLSDNSVIYPFDGRLQRLKDAFNGMEVAIDATSDSSLSCLEIDSLYDYRNGYEKWVSFVLRLNSENCFKSLTPTLIMNYDDPNFEDNLQLEVRALSEHFDTLIYRDTIEEEYCYTDLPFILSNLPSKGHLIVLLDCGYTPQAMEENVSNKLIKRIENLKQGVINDNCEIAFCATSFPNNISDIGGQSRDEFRIAEVSIHDRVRALYPDVRYGDYGSINPKRNDNITMARGWIPRIDVPLSHVFFYYRQRRANNPYIETYKNVAKKVMMDSKFPHSLSCWGVSQIDLCRTLPPAASPNYWISVRMNIHIEQQIGRLESIDLEER